MADEDTKHLDKRSKPEEKYANKRVQSLQDQLKEKDKVIENYEIQFKKLYEDFNYNVELIFDRDKEIEILNEKVDELTYLNSTKDEEILQLKQTVSKLKKFEQENLMLNKKLSILEAEKRTGAKTDLKAPRLDYKNLLKDSRNLVSKKVSNLKYEPFQEKSLSFYQEQSMDPDISFPDLNFDLEARIKMLEIENNTKERKSSSLSSSRVLEKPEESDIDITGAREKVKKQEKEISELIKSLQDFKNQNDFSNKTKLKTYDDQISALNQDIERLRAGEIRSSSRRSVLEETDKKYIPIIRPRSSFDKRFN
jgi:hypothetical protein